VVGYRKRDRDNEAGSNKGNENSSCIETVCKTSKWLNKMQNKSFGFTNIDVDGEERPQCLL
jgi:hypothetical protein